MRLWRGVRATFPDRNASPGLKIRLGLNHDGFNFVLLRLIGRVLERND